MKKTMIVTALLLVASAAWANGFIPENYPALEEIRAETSHLTAASTCLLVCGGALIVAGGALLLGDDGAPGAVSGFSTMGAGLALGYCGWELRGVAGRLADWIP